MRKFIGWSLITSVPVAALAVTEVPRTKLAPTPTGENVLKSGTKKFEPLVPKVLPTTLYKAAYVEVENAEPSHSKKSLIPLMVWVVGTLLLAYITIEPIGKPSLLS
tara:strand:+ start:556 stop:873 length:318 start_codon:yes stop_codon:yes gene_type:complete